MPSSSSICRRARGADVLEAAAPVADDDGLLARPLDVHVGVDLGEVALRDHLLDHHRDGVRQLVAYALQRRLADQLRHQHLLRVVGEHVVRVELRRLAAGSRSSRRRACRPGARRPALTGTTSANSPSSLTASNCSASRFLSTRSVLVTTASTVAFRLGQLAGDEPVAPADRLVRRHAQADHVDLAPGLPDQVVEALAEQRPGAVQARGVDEHELRVRPVQRPPG